ncbi:cancer-associated gene 1 protein isoform X1 [Dipodomys merriami]|uniref:cancer-associated gene 1 protein isoform X1 n=1 Tax=Dipodomys merriami TaxID=94247 RepID=UPI003855E748
MEKPSIIQQLGIRTLRHFGHRPWHRKKKKRLLSSPAYPIHSEVDASHEKLGSMSESDAVNVSGLSQDLSHSDSLFCMEASPVTLDLPQNETKNVKMENESTPTLSEDVYSIQDNLLSGDVSIGNDTQNVQMEPVNSSISSSRQFEPICKFHWIEEFYDDTTTFQNIMESLSYTENSELGNHGYHYAKETNTKQDSLEEENPMETCLSANKDQPAHNCINQSPGNPSITYYNKETPQFTENLKAECTAKESAVNTSQLHDSLDKGSLPRNVENAFYNKNSFKLLDLRVNYKAEETEVSSKEIQNSRDVSHQEEVTSAGVKSIGIAMSWSPVGNPRSGVASQKHCMTPAVGQDIENLWPLEEDLALNEVLQKLKHTNRKQLVQIQDLQYRNEHLEKQVKELQMKITKQQTFVDIISKLKENIEELIEDKYNVMLEKSDTNKKLQNLQEIFNDTQKHLQETKKEKETLQLQFKKLKANYLHLQERFLAEMQEKNLSVDQCIEMDKTLYKKEEEIKSLQQLKGELEMATTSALELLEREKETREQELLTLQAEFQKQEKESLREKRKLKLRVEKLIMQVKNLLFTCEHEKAKSAKLQQHIDEMKNENAELQQQIRRCGEQNRVPKFEMSQLMGQLEDVMEPGIIKDTKMSSNLCLNCKEDSMNSSSARETLQMQTSKIHSLLSLVAKLLTCQDISNPDTEHFKDNKKVSDIMLQKLKNFQHRKKELDKQLLKHKDKISMLRELIARETAYHKTEGADIDSNEANDSRDTSFLLTAKLDKYHNLNEELDFLITKLGGLLESKEDHYSRLIEENAKYRRHVGNLINKVTSYEEIIKCADQRLEISHSQIAHLEERNRHLEDLIRLPKEKARKQRSRLENRPKSMTLVISK